MGRDADVAEPREDVLADPVVDHALAVDRALFLGVEGGGIVLEYWMIVPGSGPS